MGERGAEGRANTKLFSELVGRPGWRVNVHDRGRDVVISSGPTEAEALVAALEAAP